ncbi:MAG TPA: hypothetical protein VI793_19770 [Anaerolineales bacterium]|nr:hypothetical protein [Anaerolineales bacterium]
MDEKPIEKRYGTLRAIAEALTFIGSLAAIVGPVAVVVSVMADFEFITKLLVGIGGAAALPIGLLMLASGESINVQLDTEHNTRQAALAIAIMLADLHELKDVLGRIDASTRRMATAVEALAATIRQK